jgi:hypothetical protein
LRDWEREFEYAFLALTIMPRARDGALATGFKCVYWAERARDTLLSIRAEVTSVSMCPTIAAAIAHGDVSHSVGANFPNDMYLGLGDHSGNPPVAAWRDILQGTRKLLEPIAIKHEVAPPSPTKLFYHPSERMREHEGASIRY